MAKADKAVDSTLNESTVENSTGQAGTVESLVAGDANSPVAADPVPAVPGGPIVFNLIAGPALRYDDQLVGEGEIVAQLTLAPGSPFDARFVTRSVENFLIRVERANQ